MDGKALGKCFFALLKVMKKTYNKIIEYSE